jgi:hypothetical protein
LSENVSDGKRLIEVSLPLAAISEQSAREKSIRHGHISTLHIWWARRPLAAMRAAIFASLVPAPETDEEREKLEELIATIVDWDQVKDGNSPKVLDAFGGRPPRLLDPFMGCGATGLEALRLGCETHAVELNPVAHLIELCTLVYPQKYGGERGIGESGNRESGIRESGIRESESRESADLTPADLLAGKPAYASRLTPHWPTTCAAGVNGCWGGHGRKSGTCTKIPFPRSRRTVVRRPPSSATSGRGR